MNALRKIYSVNTDRVRNSEVRKMVELKNSIGVKKRKGKLHWFGHIESLADE